VNRPAVWRVSSYSGQASNCVEVRDDLRAVRDSKDPNGPSLQVSAFREFVAHVKSHR
jgi:hypothetical protein